MAHNLDFWLPPVAAVIQDRLGEFPEVDKGRDVGPVPLADGGVLEGALTGNPRMGGAVWQGAEDAAAVVSATVEAADGTGRLRGILEAVRAHRVADDFSPSWSYAREDFERKLYRKRDKVSVRFVELTDTHPDGRMRRGSDPPGWRGTTSVVPASHNRLIDGCAGWGMGGP